MQSARTIVLQKYPNISAELLLNQGWVFGRPQEMKLFVDGFRATNIPVCAKSDISPR
jgi:hypothetical protein